MIAGYNGNPAPWHIVNMLSIHNHDRDSAGLRYIYPVISRRSGGLSIGVNLNPNQACNWRCAYCQVPGLRRGSAPTINLIRLRDELTGVLDDVRKGDFYRRFEVPDAQQTICDIAISGDGEATTADEFPDVVAVIGEVCRDFQLGGRIKLVLISNGSQARRDQVQAGLRAWAELGGEMWFKLDSATAEGMARINGINASPASVMANLQAATTACPVWLQTCIFRMDGHHPSQEERLAYLGLLEEASVQGILLQGVLLYGLARPSQQPEASRLSPASRDFMDAMAADIRALGLEVRVNP